AEARHHVQPRVTLRSLARRLGSAILAVVVDQDDRPRAAIVLRQQRAHARGNVIGLVACGHHGQDPRPRPRPRRRAIVALGAAPKGSAGEEEVKPDRKGNAGNNQHARREPPLCAGTSARNRHRRRLRKNNSTYSMNWARKSWTDGEPLVDYR